MAESGRRISDIRSSILKGSEEDFEHICEPCSTEGQRLEAFKFCLECREYICRNCVRYHQKMTMLKHHHLVDDANVAETLPTNTTLDLSTEKCPIHENEVIKFFCPKHGALGCTDCITMHHRTCKIDYIPDKCFNISESNEYKETMKILDKKITETDTVIRKAAAKDKEVDDRHEEALIEIVKFRKEIDDRLDFLQRHSETNASKLKTTAKQNIKGIIDTCSSFSSDLKQLQSSLKACAPSKQDGQIFCSLKRAQNKFQSNEVEMAEAMLEKTNVQFVFEGNVNIEKFLSQQDFGLLSKHPKTLDSQRSEKTECSTYKLDFGSSSSDKVSKAMTKSWQYTEIEDINITSKTDMSKCTITGCDIMSSGNIVLADYNNYRLKIVDIERKIVVCDKELDSRPWDVTRLPQDKIAVTLPLDSLVVTTTADLSIDGSFKVKGHCYGICFNDNHLYIVCQNPKAVLVTDLQGAVKSLIPLRDKKLFCNPTYIVVSQALQLMYISDCDSNSVATVTFKGLVSAVYREQEFRGPLGMAMLDGTLFVCCKSNNTVHHISGDLKQSKKVIRIRNLPQSICYSPVKQHVYIGRWRDDFMSILYVQ